VCIFPPAPPALPSGKEPLYPVNRREVGPKDSTDVLDKKKSLVPAKITTMDSSFHSLDTILTMLSWNFTHIRKFWAKTENNLNYTLQTPANMEVHNLRWDACINCVTWLNNFESTLVTPLGAGTNKIPWKVWRESLSCNSCWACEAGLWLKYWTKYGTKTKPVLVKNSTFPGS